MSKYDKFAVITDMDGWDLFQNGLLRYRLRRSTGWTLALVEDLLLAMRSMR